MCIRDSFSTGPRTSYIGAYADEVVIARSRQWLVEVNKDLIQNPLEWDLL